MAAPLDALPFVCVGTGQTLRAAAELLELLGAQVTVVPQVHSAEHARRIEVLEPLGAIDEIGTFATPPFPVVRLSGREPAEAWARSGALALTGPADGDPLAIDASVPARLLALGAVIQLLAATRSVDVQLDPLARLAERAAIADFGRRGTTSVGGYCHVVDAADGRLALNLARPDDVALLPAWLDGEVDADDPWPEVAAAIARRGTQELDARAALLGLPVGVVPSRPLPITTPFAFVALAAATPEEVRARTGRRGLRVGGGEVVADVEVVEAPKPAADPLVVDLSSLWAGPLAGSLLVEAGARVIKVEGRRRPDGARNGPAGFFDLMHHGKECIALDFADDADVAVLRAMVERADVVIEGSRPRVMQGLGIDPRRVAGEHGTTWIAITGHGYVGSGADRVGFGDDTAAAAGLILDEGFVADAVADPIAGMYAAAVAIAALVGRRGQLVDLSLVAAAGYARGDRQLLAQPGHHAATPPQARVAAGPAPRLDQHGLQLRAEFA